MGNGFEDYNNDKPAKKHQEEARLREEGEKKGKGISRRDALKTIGKGMLLGLGFAVGLETLNKIKKSEDKSEDSQEKASVEAVATEAELIKSRISSIESDLNFIKGELEIKEINAEYRAKLNSKVFDWEEELTSLSSQILKEDKEAGDEALLRVILERLEELEKNISIERLGFERGFHLGA